MTISPNQHLDDAGYMLFPSEGDYLINVTGSTGGVASVVIEVQ